MEYFNINRLLKNNYMAICCALLKYDYSNFAITILEYCSPDKCLIREKHYWDIVMPKYNIAKNPTAPMSGRTHSDDTKIIMSDAKKGKTHSNETKIIMSDAKKGENNPMFNKPRAEGAGRPSQAIEVTDIKNNTTTYYDSIREAAKALNIPHFTIIRNYIIKNQKKPYKGQYTFKKL